ncbi:stage III sporulation protein AF [Geosporobacter ferrireducens]|uniref:Stage III sporulation protein AF n=2 Tax=Geosporobacter ferrireducens TaxID=1424294 RepID=A0A1D8GB70_9FIRM|nr:stage III sporulation protein AF [Geosporobacter ferrireducens]AOT68159.1 stage III sporulation protein AF [Geosporobacter ferrireducens]
MAFLRTWVLNIVTVIIFITFLEILLPNSDMKKYIKMIVGLLVMLVVLNPLLELATGKVNLEEEIFKTSAMMDQKNLAYDLERLEGEQDQQLVVLYKSKIENHLRTKIERENKLKVVALDLDIVEEKSHKDFGKLKNIHLSVSALEKPPESSAAILPVSKIYIEVAKGGEKAKAAATIDDGLSEKLKSELASLYEISPHAITIEQMEPKN